MTRVLSLSEYSVASTYTFPGMSNVRDSRARTRVSTRGSAGDCRIGRIGRVTVACRVACIDHLLSLFDHWRRKLFLFFFLAVAYYFLAGLRIENGFNPSRP